MRGQALVEYAILLVLIVLIAAGGIELASAGLNFYQVRNAVSEGVEHWTYATGNDDPAYVVSGIYGGPVLPITRSTLTGGVIGLGDHSALADFRRPSCTAGDPNSYDDGLPAESYTQSQNHVFLFNPKPIDITDCVGLDGTDTTLGREAALAARLPPVNRALYPVYTLRCANAAGDEIDCTDPNAAARYLRLPGKLDPGTDTVRLAYLRYDVPATDPSGNPNPLYQQLDFVGDTFAIQCRRPLMITDFDGLGAPLGAPETRDWEQCDSEVTPGDICWNDDPTPNPVAFACDVRVTVRYRHVFYSFLQFPFVFWQNPLPQSALDELDLGPGGTGGVLGGEVGRGNVRLFNRTVRWCFETVTTSPGPAMNGKRTIQTCS